MDKNTLVGFALIGAVIVGFGIYNRPSQEEMARAQHYQDSIQAVAQKQEQMTESSRNSCFIACCSGFYFFIFPSIARFLKEV